ncbi:MAG: DNA repair protein RadA [Verrucomicrobia bacterium]|nr:DNA repair protein RadA [Verrucomicrobiota bacterium]
MKTKESWLCSECGDVQAKWVGSCFACKNWNTMQRFVEKTEASSYAIKTSRQAKPIPLDEVSLVPFEKTKTGLEELDRLLGGGFVTGSLTLLGGDPGVGKSTLMLMLADLFCKKGFKVLYISGEESIEQTTMRAKRLKISSKDLYLFSETVFEEIKKEVENIKPQVLIVDSVQIVYKSSIASYPGSVTQVKEIAIECMHIAKRMHITTFLIGHVTKTGELAGPRVLEHIVDTVLDFEGDSSQGFRMLRAHKNRFGPTEEVALFQMTETGLAEINSPSEVLLKERIKGSSGSTIIPTIEGSRAILVEIQALVASSPFSTAARRASGIDGNRLALLLAVLEKRMGYHFHNLDVFVSIAGGLKIKEPAIDLGLLIAIASSFANRPIPLNTLIVGEVGLGGEVRSVPRIDVRIKEAVHMGFERCILPKRCLPKKEHAIELVGVERIEEAVSLLIG